jgi:hypothetical protein
MSALRSSRRTVTAPRTVRLSLKLLLNVRHLNAAAQCFLISSYISISLSLKGFIGGVLLTGPGDRGVADMGFLKVDPLVDGVVEYNSASCAMATKVSTHPAATSSS